MTERVRWIYSLESELNSISFYGVQIGSVMALYWNNLFRGIPITKPLKSILYAIFIHFKLLFKRYTIINHNRKVLYFKSGNLRHYNKLADVFKNDIYLKHNTLFIEQNSTNAIDKKKIMLNLTFLEIFEIWRFLWKNKRTIWVILNDHDLKKASCISIFFILFCQLASVKSVIKFLNYQTEATLICGDYDRGKDTAVLFASAKALNLKSITLQHGVINPPYGYNPIISDEIWVWGEMAKNQLVELGVDSRSIKITGTPIIEKKPISQIIKDKVIHRINLDVGRNIILALSTPDKLNDIKLVTFFKEIQIKYGQPKDNFLVKIHPARNPEKYRWITEDFKIKILPSSLIFEEFINIVDILLIHSSGIATESILFDIRVGVIDILSISPGNGIELHKYCGVPLLKEPSDFVKLMNNRISDKKRFISNVLGDDASKKIAKSIYEKLG